MDVAVPANHIVKVKVKEGEKIAKYLDLAPKKKTTTTEKVMEHEGNSNTSRR